MNKKDIQKAAGSEVIIDRIDGTAVVWHFRDEANNRKFKQRVYGPSRDATAKTTGETIKMHAVYLKQNKTYR